MLSVFTKRNTIALAASCLASLMSGLEISSVPVTLPTLERVLHASFSDLQWIMNAYTIAVTTVLMATGALADRYGRKRAFVVSVVAFGVASVACGLAQSAAMLIAARFLQGVGGGAMLICLIAVLSHQFASGKERAVAFSAWGIVFGIGLGFGPIIGAGIVALANWQWVFLIHGQVAVVTLVLVLRGVEESRDPDAQRLDIAGLVRLSLAVFCLAFVITQGPVLGFTSATALGVGTLAAASFVAFVVAEHRNPRPMVDFAVFRIRPFSGALLGSMGMNFSFWPFMIYLPIYFQGRLGYDATAAGLALLAYTIPTLLVPPLAERLLLRYRPGLVIPAGLMTIGIGFFLMKLGGSVVAPSWLTMLPGALVAGTGLGLTNTPVTNTTTASLPAARAGMASGIDMSARMTSLATNIALMGLILISGVTAYLSNPALRLPHDVARHEVAQRIAAGDLSALDRAMSAAQSAAIVRGALTEGFNWVLLYDGVSVCLLAMASFFIFRQTNGETYPGPKTLSR